MAAFLRTTSQTVRSLSYALTTWPPGDSASEIPRPYHSGFT